MIRLFLFLVGALFVGYVVVARGDLGPLGTTDITELSANPTHYYNKTISISGIVVDGVGLWGAGAYLMQSDGDAEILVVSYGGSIPTAGSRIRVTGKFKQAFAVGSQSYNVIIQDR